MADRGRGRGRRRRNRGRGRGNGEASGPAISRGGAPQSGPPSMSTAEVEVTSGGEPSGGQLYTPAAPPESIPSGTSGPADTTGTKRPGYGTLGTPVQIVVNCFRMDIPVDVIHHYDVSIISEDMFLHSRLAIDIIHQMQDQNHTIFTKRGCYDGHKNLYSPIRYPLGDEAQFRVNHPVQPNRWRVRIKWVGLINPLSAARYVEGKKTSHDRSSEMTVNVCNVAIRMQPIRDLARLGRSFLNRSDFRPTGGGIERWRGYFQSARPMIGNMVVIIDIGSAPFYKRGPLIRLCMEFLGEDPDADPVPFLSGHHMDAQTRIDLLRFIRGLSLNVRRTTGDGSMIVRSIRDISENGADTLNLHDNLTLATFYAQDAGYILSYPTLVCIKISQVAWVPLECCDVLPGQFYRQTQSPEHNRRLTEFSRLRPDVRLQSIRNGLQVLGYSISPCLRELGVRVDPNPMTIAGRILPRPTLACGGNATIQPRNGQWNMQGKTLYKPAVVQGCAIIIYDGRFGGAAELHLKQNLFNISQRLGILGIPADPLVLRKAATGRAYWNHLKEVGLMHKRAKGTMPNLIIVVLPDSAPEDLYVRIKNAGDIKIGVATQCLKAGRCVDDSEEYYVNVCLKINAKLGGINFVLNPETIPLLTDPTVPSIVMGAHLVHPGPDEPFRPSYATVVGCVGSDNSKYIAVSRNQVCRGETIEGLIDMVSDVIRKSIQYRQEVENDANPVPQRIIFYRGGISEGQFLECSDAEIPQIHHACHRIGIPRPKLTFIVVNKRHHIRFFPSANGPSDLYGNTPAGLVVDRAVTSPVEYDFYLQSHANANGTSRSAHYTVLVDENKFTPDDLQRMTFSLCHVNARSTRSISIVTAVRYAWMVCRRAKHHYDPDGPGFEDEAAQRSFQAIHPNTGQSMYFL